MRRLSILVVALLAGAAAPARAWCEAACLEQPAESASPTPHCPSHEPAPDGPSLSGADLADCPTLESARPALAKLDFAVALNEIAAHLRTLAPSHLRTLAPSHPRTLAPSHLTAAPLRL